MTNFQEYKTQRMKRHPAFWDGYGERFETFKLGVLLKQAREDAGLTQTDVAQRLHTTTTVIAKIEHHAPDVRLSLLEQFAEVLGKRLHVVLE